MKNIFFFFFFFSFLLFFTVTIKAALGVFFFLKWLKAF